MRIGIDGGCLANRRGFGRFAREMVRSLAEAGSEHHFVVYLDRPSAERVTVPAGMETILVDVRVAPSVAASSTGRRSVRDMLAMGRAVARGRLDAIYFPATYSFFPVWNAGKVLVTMHDTLALAHPELVFPGGRGRLAWRAKEYAAALRADRIVTVSEAARRDLAAWFRLPAGRIHVVTEGPDPAFGPEGDEAEADAVLARYGVEPGTKFLLYVGGLSPHKNLERLIEAFRDVDPARREVRLVLVGDFADVFHTHHGTLTALRDRLGLGGRILFPGFVPDVELSYFYRRAYALVQPSLMEGFGLPPVEAMVSGTPVLSSTAGSLPEVVGPAGLYFDPTRVDRMSAAIGRLLDDPDERSRLAASARVQAGRFTWERSARLLLDCFAGLEAPRKASRPDPVTRRRPAKASVKKPDRPEGTRSVAPKSFS